MEIVDAETGDLPSIQAIYAHHVLTGTGTFEDVPPTLEEMEARAAAKAAAGFAWLVAKDASGILGFGYYGVRGQGVGKALVSALLDRARDAGFKQMLALIGDSENTASIGMHASLGFQHCGTMRKVGYKLDRWLDVVIMQKAL
jgi:phosphinothricin acetyltransferase